MTLAVQKQLRHVFAVISGATPDSGNADYWDGNMLWATPEDIGSLDGYWLRDTRRMITHAGYESCGTTTAPPNSVVLTKRAPIGQVALLADEACSNQGCFLLIPRHETDTRFYYYWLSMQTGYLQILGRGSTFMELSTDGLKSLNTPHPSPPQQRAIADYLDRETSRLDALVAAKERVLGLLAEKRRALITRAVTRGLDPNVPLRDSGIQWLGVIPAHWKTPPVYARFVVQLGKMLDEKRIKGAHLAPYLRNIDVQWGAINTADLPEMDFDEDDRRRYALRVDDILVCEGGEMGRCALWDGTHPECYYQKALHRLRSTGGEDEPAFFVLVMRAIGGFRPVCIAVLCCHHSTPTR